MTVSYFIMHKLHTYHTYAYVHMYVHVHMSLVLYSMLCIVLLYSRLNNLLKCEGNYALGRYVDKDNLYSQTKLHQQIFLCYRTSLYVA